MRNFFFGRNLARNIFSSRKFFMFGVSAILTLTLLCGIVASNLLLDNTVYTYAQSDTPQSWGLSHRGGGKLPTPPDNTDDFMEKTGSAWVGCQQSKKVYLTFDIGYEAGFTAECLDILKKHNAKSIFFLCGNYLKELDLVKRMLSDGHLIGNHTDRHLDLPTKSNEVVLKDIKDFNEKFYAKYGKDHQIKFFRPPSGRYSRRVIELSNSVGLKNLMWSIAIVDWGSKPIDPVKSAALIEKRLHNGAIILLHISNSGMPKMLNILLPRLKELGYEIGCPTDFLK